uniref:Uncharacterized protein n=1 Tax=Triticum urartu TaxID=4572 RepID=A0A8R7QDS1_TRIUA
KKKKKLLPATDAAWAVLRPALACPPPPSDPAGSYGHGHPSPPDLATGHLLLVISAVAGDGGVGVQVRALQDRREGGLPRHAPLLRHGQPTPPPPWSYPLFWHTHRRDLQLNTAGKPGISFFCQTVHKLCFTCLFLKSVQGADTYSRKHSLESKE